ncbi:MAG: hypothetical protein LUQ04_03030 [Methanoregula sp.]|nr:hypothetical protein [Methanoregula sp.]
MDTVSVFIESLRILFSFLLLLFVPGFSLSLVIFPRLTDLSIIDRLVYSTVLSISSSITSVVFMDIALRLDLTLDNFILVTGVFSVLILLFWVCERWYLNSRLKKHPEPQLSEDNKDLQRSYSREINAIKDRFRQDTRTVVVYHESEQSGTIHIDHSYLMDVGEEIDIQQVVENKLKVTDSFIVEPPYPGTRYFELVIREYNEDGLSQVDELQIYPVLVTKNPGRRVSDTAPEHDTLQITERIYQKTSTTEVQWIYSHDFHIFAIIHEEDTLDQLVDRILGKLDEIVSSTKSGIHISSHNKDQQILRDAFDRIMKKPRVPPSHPLKIPGLPEFQAGVQSKAISRRPVILPSVLPEEIPKRTEVQIRAEPKEITGHPAIQPDFELKEIPKSPEIQPQVLPVDRQKRPVLQGSIEPKEVPLRPVMQPRVQSKNILKHPENKLVVDSIRKLQKDILRDLDMFGVTPESFKKSRKNMENIKIPKKADVKKKLADAQEEMIDLDWLYE